MRYVWDPVKDALNRQKHGLALSDGIPALEDPNGSSWYDVRFEYQEERIVTLGRGERRILYVVSTKLEEEFTRIISVRRAEKHEIKHYLLG
jgi:uncharacterized protein